MALADLSFKLYTDAGLTTPFSGNFAMEHNIPSPNAPKDFQLWFGSNGISTLTTTVNPNVDNITLTPVEKLPAWVASTAYIAGAATEPTVRNGFRYEATTAGTSAATEPSWPTGGIGSTIIDGTVVWTLVSTAREPTEIKLSATAAGLAGATPGAALSLGTSLSSGVANAKEVNIRVENAVMTLSNNTAHPELALDINDVTEA